ncbi:ABC transporter ATP-binding protein [Halegenticoccus tardaugens]|uniref:ABC transporter ATP-binding protein n=1 Tax=Halegenticoccus tardaugens TaxID=2071624 RepID=UPI00100B8E2F|nr:ABC transporter ATP-binding protein [Halegenticoccus tardaugens]
MGEVTLQNVSKRFGDDVVAVDGIDASFSDGAYTMILGPSGCGKTTTLRMIAGLETPSEGEILINDERVTNEPPQKRDLSLVFQNLALWDHKTVEENLAFGMRMRGVDREERRARVVEIAEILRIEDKLDESPAALSGGQQQRVALGRSLVREPELLLLDEPLSSLDERLRLEMRTELARVHQELGTTFIHVTHNQEDAMTIADEILLLNGGRLQQFDDPLELYHNPANEFVADFIGSPSMNLFDATFVTDEETYLDAGAFRLTIPARASDAFRDNVDEGDVRVGVRPESFRVLLDDRSPVRNGTPTIDATVTIVETFGDFNWYYLDADIDTDIVVQSADEAVMAGVDVGDAVTVAADVDRLHLFDPRTEAALL